MSCITPVLPEFSGGLDMSWFLKGRGRAILLRAFLLPVLALAACGPVADFTDKINDSFNGKSSASTATTAPVDANGLYDPDAAAPPPPGAGTHVPLPGQSGAPAMPNGLPALPPEG